MSEKPEQEETPQNPSENEGLGGAKKWTPPYKPGLPAWKRFGHDRPPGRKDEPPSR